LVSLSPQTPKRSIDFPVFSNFPVGDVVSPTVDLVLLHGCEKTNEVLPERLAKRIQHSDQIRQLKAQKLDAKPVQLSVSEHASLA
jgi:hypothetical protein